MTELVFKKRSDLVSVHNLALIGQACRLPGADDADALWQLLDEARSSVSARPVDRWRVERFLHPRRTEPGFSYTFAGGYIEHPLAFDPAVFGISPREAQQIDPQQRLLLEVVWEALEDAGIAPSSLAGEPVGVYVGASNVDYQNAASTDPAAIESHFMTGNSLSIVSNRISYVFDWRGPSFTVDSACSSSFAALAQAMAAIDAGIIDTAVVAGVNLLLSPAPFIGFSRASMLSPTGLCRPFSADGDGYVRSEGAIAIVLRRLDAARTQGNRIRAVVTAGGVNSDGRTNGISLPSVDGQRRLLEATYDALGLDPNMLAFVEAHGTGTPVGDPAEATAIGQALGRRRRGALPIGSIKSNIGHLECVSGLAGLLKTSLAFEKRLYPPTLYLERTNPNIDFPDLNLLPTRQAMPLPADEILHAGICNYGFGGTNAHIVMRSATAEEARGRAEDGKAEPGKLLTLSARSKESLAALAGAYADALEAEDAKPGLIAAATGYERDLLDHRLVLPVGDGREMAASLRLVAAGEDAAPRVATGTAAGRAGKVAFVYSGNGAQWVGMGRLALTRNPVFRRTLNEIDALFRPMAGWSIVDAMVASDLDEQLKKTSVAQPILFAIQVALTRALGEAGIAPDMVLGHSVGEVAAAHASGALDLADSVYLIHHRSQRQEDVAGQGTMMVLAQSETAAREFLAAHPEFEAEIAAVNGPGSVTLTGRGEAIAGLAKAARKARIATVALAIDYPFHSRLLDGAREAALAELKRLAPRRAAVPFVSAVTGGELAGTALDAEYWWKNIRQPVQFTSVVREAGKLGATAFVEIGPKPILIANIADTLRDAGLLGEAVGTLGEKDDPEAGDPVIAAAARAIARGAAPQRRKVYGTRPRQRVKLPSYRWQRQDYTLPLTNERLDLFGGTGGRASHPLLGRRVSAGAPEWRAMLDAEVVPYLADHKVDDEPIMPAAGLVEMALAVGRQVHGEGPLRLQDFDVLRPLQFAPEAMREVSTRYDATSGTIEIWSRRRLSGEGWYLHAHGRIVKAAGVPGPLDIVLDPARTRTDDAEAVYAAARRAGLDYGPSFRRVVVLDRDGNGADIVLAPPEASTGAFEDHHLLHPTSSDAAMHPLFLEQVPVKDETRAYLPVRFHAVTLWKSGATIKRALLKRVRETETTKKADILLLDGDGEMVAEIRGAVFRLVVLSRRDDDDRLFRVAYEALLPAADAPVPAVAAAAEMPTPDAWLLMQAFARSLAYETVRAVIGKERATVGALVEQGRIAEAQAPRFAALLELLAAQGLGTRKTGGFALAGKAPLPSAAILQTLAQRHPECNAEIRLAAHAAASLATELAGGPAVKAGTILEGFEEAGLPFRPLLGAIADAVREAGARFAPARPHVAVLHPWTAGLLQTLLPFARSRAARITLVGADEAEHERIAAKFGAGIFGRASGGEAISPHVDLIVGLAFAPLMPNASADAIEALRNAAPGAAIAVAALRASPAFDVLLGGQANWFAQSLDPDFPVGQVPGAEETARVLEGLGAEAVETLPVGGLGALLTGHIAVPAPAIVPDAKPILALPVEGAEAFLREIAGEGGIAAREAIAERLEGLEAAADLVLPVTFASAPEVSASIAATILELRATLEWAKALGRPIRLWLVTRQARQPGAVAIDPAATAISAFFRVAVNEYPDIDLRLVDVPEFDAGSGGRVRALIAGGTAEAELVVTADNLLAVRAQRGAVAAPLGVSETRRVKLTVPHRGVLSSARWVAAERAPPAGDEIEVAVGATGLNFRDVMLALGALDDDILGVGLTEAALGFEFAGTVTRVGPGAKGHKVGDRVMGFAQDAFASHVTIPGWFAFKLPDTVAVEAAAGIPVAFSTAWYGMIECARLKRGETVLIHGAAGGVGLAAVQIALSRGAKVIATAGTADKASLLKMLGVEAVYDSRSLAFADEILRAHGGVDVVLNSLAGEAMLESIRILKPFGRFVELGKRDFLANTSLGVRPLARNLSYFGVDLDQLLAHDRQLVVKLMQRLYKELESGKLRPIPYRVFDGAMVGEAFRQMQAASHVGKIVVKPAAEGVAAPGGDVAFVPGEGVHLVIGGTQGFGFETALWLSRKGAGTVVVASRSGIKDPEIEARRAAAEAPGRRILSETLDIRDEAAVRALIAKIEREHGPLAGVIHTAMVLEDGLIQGLDEAQLGNVLPPKVDGVLALDAATQGMKLDYFVVYSSAAALIGSPGQGAYVAANAFLEGVIEKRRAGGLPGLAVAWGAIADAGVLAKNQSLSQRLARATGVTGVKVADGLAFLERLLAEGDGGEGVHTYSEIRRSAIADQLAILRTPAFKSAFLTSGKTAEAGSEDALAAIEGKTDAEALEILLPMLAGEIGKILRLPADAIDPNRSLTDLGMDSLMALELRLSVEKRFNTELPLLGIGNGRTLADLGKHMIAGLRAGQELPEEAATSGPVLTAAEDAMLAKHGLDRQDETVAELIEAVDKKRKVAGRSG